MKKATGLFLMVVLALFVTSLAATNGLPDDVAGYLNWHRANLQKSFEQSAHPTAKDIYYNDAAAAVVMSKAFPFAEGAAFLKERTDPETLTVTTIYGMQKVAGFDPDNGDWQYAVFERGEDGQFGGGWMAAADAAMCVGCHVNAKDNDYVFLSYLSN